MIIQSVNANKLIGVQEFLSAPLNFVEQCGSSPLLVLNDNKVAFYVIPANGWDLICSQMHGEKTSNFIPAKVSERVHHVASLQPGSHSEPVVERVSDQRAFEKKTISPHWPTNCWTLSGSVWREAKSVPLHWESKKTGWMRMCGLFSDMSHLLK
jgi:hypothetical protein